MRELYINFFFIIYLATAFYDDSSPNKRPTKMSFKKKKTNTKFMILINYNWIYSIWININSWTYNKIKLFIDYFK